MTLLPPVLFVSVIDRALRLFEVIFGEGTVQESTLDGLFELSTGYRTLEAHKYTSTDRGGICLGTVDTAEFESALADVGGMLEAGATPTTASTAITENDHGYVWVTIEDTDFESVLETVQAIGTTIVDAGFGPSLLAAVFPFQEETDVYLVYNFKRGNWYPYVPKDGSISDEIEADIESILEGELTFEPDPQRRYSYADIPI